MEQQTKEKFIEEIERVLQVVREGLAMHGGNVELVDCEADTGKVSLRLQGACVGCPMSEITLKMGIEAALQDAIPEIKEVISVE